MASMLTPVLALIVLTLVVWVWMYVTRIPAMRQARIAPQDARHPGSLNALPSSVRQVADNYNHLLEQPVIFYAIVFYIVLSGHSDLTHVGLAWTYVLLRLTHTLIQCTVNVVTARFIVFALSTLVLMIMVGRELFALL
jgi:hypothetical protein